MSVNTTEPPALAVPRFHGKYLSLTSFKRDGTGVATPVWFVADGERLLITTDAQSFKVRRIRRNPLILPIYRLVRWLRGDRGSGEAVALAITPDA